MLGRKREALHGRSLLLDVGHHLYIRSSQNLHVELVRCTACHSVALVSHVDHNQLFGATIHSQDLLVGVESYLQ